MIEQFREDQQGRTPLTFESYQSLALLPNPQLIFLDELTTGLDPQARHTIWDLVQEIRQRGTTVFLTTHFMEEAERLCDRVAIIDHGRIVGLDTPATLIRNLGAEERVVFHVDQPLPDGFQASFSTTIRLEIKGERVSISSNNGRKTPLVSEVVNRLGSYGIHFRDLRTVQPDLEDVFLSLTGREIRD